MSSKKYLGQFCFMEQSLKTGSTYDNGEYLIMQESPNVLYGIKPVPVYGGHELKGFPIVGDKAWTVVNAYRDDERALRLASDLEEFDASKGVKPTWIGSVYAGAVNNAKTIRRIIEIPPAPRHYQSTAAFVAGEVVSVVLTLRDGSVVNIGNGK